MNPRLKAILKEEFPTVFSRISPCGGNGWFLIVWNLCKTLEPLGVVAGDMKEKYAELCFRVDNNSPVVRRAIRHAEVMSCITCENCGGAGDMTDTGGWDKVLCKQCPEVDNEN